VPQVRQNLVDHPVDSIRGCGAAYTRLARDLLRNVLILHLTSLYSAIGRCEAILRVSKTRKLQIKQQEFGIC
jgi:hypothetical protein